MDDRIANDIHYELEQIDQALWEIVKILERMEEREEKKAGEDPIARPAAENNEDTSN